MHPELLSGDPPEDWDDLPPVVRLNPSAPPFCAYRTLSILPARFLHIEHAVRIILEQVAPLPAVIDQISHRSMHEDIRLPEELTDRIGYILFSRGVDPC